MAETIHAFLKADSNDLKGLSTQEELGGKSLIDSIECVSYSHSAMTPSERGSNRATGRRQFGPITITKRIDKSSPLLMKALCGNEEIEGTFSFFRPKPTGAGEIEHFYDVNIKGGRISAIRQISPDTIDGQSATRPFTEEVELVFNDITWTHMTENTEHSDFWKTQK
ncbi:MAG: type VI secretion system tube protein TssD [Myxococcota bacterium]